MNIRRVTVVLFFLLLAGSAAGATRRLNECTTAVISPQAALTGNAMLWKNRDTDELSNRVIFVRENPFNYLALVDSGDTSGRWVYAGVNSTGFAIINSVAYNLPERANEKQDLEGLIMADALRSCRTVADFENYLRRNSGANLGSLANFGVIDAQGEACLFEVHNHGFEKYPADSFPEKYIVNTNFSRSGTPGTGRGYIRFERASTLFKTIPAGTISVQSIFGLLARDLGHPLIAHPAYADLKKSPMRKPLWIFTHDTIDRSATASAVVIHGKKKGAEESIATMWVILGEPICSIALPLWVEAEETPLLLHEGGTAPICREALRIKKKVRPFREADKVDYLEMTKLDNREGKGFLPLILKTEQEIIEAANQFLTERHTPQELAHFQTEMAIKALSALRQIQ